MVTSDLYKAQLGAKEFFCLELPFSLYELKRAYREAAKKLHTDTSGSEETKNDFIAMKECYDFLIALAKINPSLLSENGDGKTNLTTLTIDDAPLYKLGLGLGPTKNGIDCSECNHKGYTEHFRVGYTTTCPTCNGIGEVPLIRRCRHCNGSGRFTQRRSRREVDCRACGGSGKSIPDMIPCPKCFGEGLLYGKTDQVDYRKCYHCGGTGETEIYNPVLPKGRLVR